jgi:hypothetical protein
MIRNIHRTFIPVSLELLTQSTIARTSNTRTTRNKMVPKTVLISTPFSSPIHQDQLCRVSTSHVHYILPSVSAPDGHTACEAEICFKISPGRHASWTRLALPHPTSFPCHAESRTRSCQRIANRPVVIGYERIGFHEQNEPLHPAALCLI